MQKQQSKDKKEYECSLLALEENNDASNTVLLIQL
jgi:hypothetical protein